MPNVCYDTIRAVLSYIFHCVKIHITVVLDLIKSLGWKVSIHKHLKHIDYNTQIFKWKHY